MAKTYNLREVAPVEITKTVATRLQILRLIAPNSISAGAPDLLAGF